MRSETRLEPILRRPITNSVVRGHTSRGTGGVTLSTRHLILLPNTDDFGWLLLTVEELALIYDV